MKKVTVEQVMAWKPCDDYPEEIIRKLFGKRKTLAAQQILALRIPVTDRFWVIFRNEFLTDCELRLIACDFAESVLPLFEKEFPSETRPREAIRISRLFADGKATTEELAAAREAARESWKTISVIAWEIAREAAREAARAAARAVAWDVALTATESAAWEAAKTEEQEKQLEIVRRYLRAQKAGGE